MSAFRSQWDQAAATCDFFAARPQLGIVWSPVSGLVPGLSPLAEESYAAAPFAAERPSASAVAQYRTFQVRRSGSEALDGAKSADASSE